MAPNYRAGSALVSSDRIHRLPGVILNLGLRFWVLDECLQKEHF
jgi:hypothetical protein